MKAMRTLISFSILCVFGCGYPGISGKVVDGVTGNPLAGAVVLAQWTKTHGFPGLTSHTVYKIEETETDKEGAFSLPGTYSPTVDPPKMVIYKKGYVPWRNDMTFEKMETYDNVIWQDNLTYKLEHWKDNYSKQSLILFIDVMGTNFNITPKFSKIESEISKEAQAEVDAKKKMLKK
jgi:hypothetical protein